MSKVIKKSDTNEEYHSNLDYLGKSLLHNVSISPKHFKYALENREPPTEAMKIGTAFHTLVLEPEKFEEEYAIIPKVDLRTKEGKAIISALASTNKILLTSDVYTHLTGMRDSLMQNKYAVALLTDSEIEQSYYWTDERTGVKLKCRPDIRKDLNSMSVIVDLKSCNKADINSIMKDCINYGYDLQAAQYTTGVQLYHNKEHRFLFMFVEKTPPYAVNILEADALFMQKGYDDFRLYLGTIAQCRKENNWYSYNGFSGLPQTLSLPNWLAKQYE